MSYAVMIFYFMCLIWTRYGTLGCHLRFHTLLGPLGDTDERFVCKDYSNVVKRKYLGNIRNQSQSVCTCFEFVLFINVSV